MLSKAMELEQEVARLIVASLTLEIAAEDIDPEAPLFREGLSLDSIDILEIAMVISKTYGIKLQSDDVENEHIFASLRSLSAYIEKHRTK